MVEKSLKTRFLQCIDDWIYRHIPRFLFNPYLNRKFKKLRLQFEKNYENNMLNESN